MAGLLLVGAGLGWASRVLLAPPPALPPGPSFTVMTTTVDSVARSIALNARATWTGGAVIGNVASGTVTRVRVDGPRKVSAGDALYDVNLVPVRVARGAVPAFRSLTLGTKGDDVRQLQQLLIDVGISTHRPDGVFGPGTARDVGKWQRSLGRPITGDVPLGELLFLPNLPATVTLDGVTVGAAVAPGATTANGADGQQGSSTPQSAGVLGVRVLPASPSFSITLPENQAGLVRSGMVVRLQKGTTPWLAQIANVGALSSDNTAVAKLSAVKGSKTICGSQCQQVPIAGDSGIRASIELVPKTEGVVVPSTALVVGQTGSSAVIAENGTLLPVSIRASSGGRAVVTGIEAGQKIRVPGAVQP